MVSCGMAGSVITGTLSMEANSSANIGAVPLLDLRGMGLVF